MTTCIFFIMIMCSCLFIIIIIHGIHHWNYFGVYFFNDIHVDLSLDMFLYRVKTSLNISAIALEHQQYNIIS
jgi:hypothetical protein